MKTKILADFQICISVPLRSLRKYKKEMNPNINQISTNVRSSHWRCSITKGVLKNLVNFTGKQLCRSFFNKVAGASNFIKKETPT